MTDDYSPIAVGDTGAPFNAVFQKTLVDPVTGVATIVPAPLTGATITMKMLGISASNSGITQICTGIWTITDAANGKASYAYTSADVAIAGLWQLYVTITIGGKPVHADTKTLVILSAP